MLIDGYDYKFAYTVGASCDIDDLKFEKPKTIGEQRKMLAHMAVIMSKAYEDKQELEQPGYERHNLTLKQVRALSIPDFDEILASEVDDAVKIGRVRTVEAAPSKNAKGAEQQ